MEFSQFLMNLNIFFLTLNSYASLLLSVGDIHYHAKLMLLNAF